eukprot:Hpha_TRINITY_DN15029_c5_g21::TRINITY_DN15029_c5_g21_i1::g.125637::m.125637
MPKAQEGENERALTSALDAVSLFGVPGKVALVTGGGSGIGAMITVGLVVNGARVYIASRKDTSEFAAELNAKPEVQRSGGKAFSLQADVGNAAAVTKLLSEIASREAGGLSILINNAGTNYSAPLGKTDSAMFDKVMQVNTRALFHLTQEAVPLLRKAATKEDPARVINVSSIQGLRAPATDNFAYSASKAAVLMLSDHLSGKLSGKNITVNSICPGPFESRMMRGTLSAMGTDTVAKTTGLGKIGAPEDAAGAVLYLCGKSGAFVTGARITIDGGALTKLSGRL